MSAPVELKTITFGGVVTSPELAKKIHDTVVQTVNVSQLSASNIATVIRKTMEIVGKVDGLNGPSKKTLVIDITNEIVNGSKLDDAVKELLITIVNTVGPTMVDELVSAGKQAFEFGTRVLEKTKWCC